MTLTCTLAVYVWLVLLLGVILFTPATYWSESKFLCLLQLGRCLISRSATMCETASLNVASSYLRCLVNYLICPITAYLKLHERTHQDEK